MSPISNPILPAAAIGSVTLRVADEARALALYHDIIGLKVAGRDNGTLALGAGAEPFLFLEVDGAARPRPRRGLSGLYHVAILLPDRAALSSAISRLKDAGIKLGAADHAVSEAIYLYDADGNGLEIYRDRPRGEWPRRDGLIQMTNAPLDFAGILAEGGREPADEHVPAGTRIGHVHLQVTDLDAAEAFYCGVLGFAKSAMLPGALFVAANGYHHHLAFNIWDSRGAPPPPGGMAGLAALTLEVPAAELPVLRRRLAAANIAVAEEASRLVVHDPWRTTIGIAPMRAGD